MTGKGWLALLVAAVVIWGTIALSRYHPQHVQVISGSITILTRDDAIPADVLSDFAREFGYAVNVQNYDSNAEVRQILSKPGAQYDLVMPSLFMAEYFLRRGMLQSLDKRYIPNASQIDPGAFPVAFDKPNNFVLPYQWAEVGIAYDRNSADGLPKSWADLFREAIKVKSGGMIALVDNPRNVMGTVLLMLGHSPNTENIKEIDEAGAVLQRLSPDIADVDTDNALNDLLTEKVALALAWGPDVAKAMRQKKSLRLSLPKEGTVIFDICFAVPKNADKPHVAQELINFLLRPEIAARVTNRSYCPTTVTGASAFVDRFILNGPAFFRNSSGKNFTIADVGPAADQEYNRVWTQFAAPYEAKRPAESHHHLSGDEPLEEAPRAPAPPPGPAPTPPAG